MAEINFINTFPQGGERQAPLNGRNVTVQQPASGSPQARGRGNNTGMRNNNGGRGGGRGNGGRRRAKFGGNTANADLAQALSDENARLKGEFDALQEQRRLMEERKVEKIERDKEREKAYVYNRLMRALRSLDIEMVNHFDFGEMRCYWLQWFEIMVAVLCLHYFRYLLVHESIMALCLIQALYILVAEIIITPMDLYGVLIQRWWSQVLLFLVCICSAIIFLDYSQTVKYIPLRVPEHFEHGMMVTKGDMFRYGHDINWWIWLVPACYIGFTFLTCTLSKLGFEVLYTMKLSCFGWFIVWERKKITRWNRPRILFRNGDIGFDLRPQSQKHIKLTDPELKFGLDYNTYARHTFRFMHRHGPGSVENDYVYELPEPHKYKYLEASFGLLAELSDYDICGLETDHKIAKERIKNRLRTIRSVNIDKYQAQLGNIYQHTTLIALALWHQRREQLQGLPDFD